MDGLMPTFDVNGNNNCGWGGAAAGAFAGGLVGSWFSNGWGGNGWGNRGGCGSSCGDQFVMDTLTTMRSDINSIGRDQLMQAANNAANQCTGFGTTNAAIERVGAAQALAQCRTEAAVLTTGYQGQIAAKDNTFAIVSSQKDCCCQTQRLIEAEGCATRNAIHAEGEATRALITQNEIQALRDRNCDLKSELVACQSREFSTNLASQIQASTLTAIKAMLPTTTTTTPTTTA